MAKQKLTSRSAKTIVLSLGTMLATFGSILLAMVLSRVFSETEYATYRQSLLVFTMVAPILGLGLAKSLLYFLPAEPERRRGILIESLLPLLVAGLAFLAFITLGGNQLLANLFNNPALATTLLIIAPLALFRLPESALSPCMVATENVPTAALFSAISRVAIVGTILIAVLFSPTVFSALLSNVIAIGLVSLVAIFLMFQACTGGMPSFSGMTTKLSFGIPLAMSTMVGVLSRNMDRAMVASFSTPQQFAIFENGAMELPLIAIVTGSMTSILLVDYRVMLSENRTEDMLALLRRAMMKSAIFLIPAMFLLLCVAPEFMVCMFSEKYRASADTFRVYLMVIPARTLVFGSIALAAGRTKSLMLISIITLVVNAALNYVAVQIFGPIGCAFATLIVVYLVNIYGRVLVAQKILKCTFTEFIPWKQFGILMGCSVVAVPVLLIIRNLIPVDQSLARLLVSSTVYFAITIVMFFRAGLISPGLLKSIRNRLKRK